MCGCGCGCVGGGVEEVCKGVCVGVWCVWRRCVRVCVCVCGGGGV